MAKTSINIDSISQQANEASACFRKGFEGEAQTLFITLIDELTLCVEKIQKDSTAYTELNQIFTIMMSAHQSNDTLFLADILQYDLPRTLNTHC